MKNVFKKILSGFYYLLIGIEILVLVFSLISKTNKKTPKFFGYSFYVIATPSMKGVLDVGSVIICKEYDKSYEINVGDIITYQGEEDTFAGKTITHKVIDTREENGQKYYTTKGVANTSSDPEIREDQIIGKFVYKTIVLSFLYSILSTTYGFALLVVVPILYMIINEIISMAKEIKEGSKNEKVNE